MRDAIEKSARHLYGLVHARYIVTTRGLAKMVDKYKKSDFGRCPRVYCEGQPLLPCGLDDNPGKKPVKLYCARCEDTYSPKSSRHSTIDGAYFGTSFHNILFQVYPALIPQKSLKRFQPTIFGFKVHHAATLHRWQDEQRRNMRERLADAGVAPLPVAPVEGGAGQGQQQQAPRQFLFAEDQNDDDGMGLRAKINKELDDDHDDSPDADEDPDENTGRSGLLTAGGGAGPTAAGTGTAAATAVWQSPFAQQQFQKLQEMQAQAGADGGGQNVNVAMMRARAVQAAVLRHQQGGQEK